MIDLDDVLTWDSWVIADHHWEHPRIREYQDRPPDHFERMRNEWIEYVGHDDVILHLGDLVCFGDIDRHPFWIEGLPGRKYLIRGNHDKHSNEWYGAAGFTVLGRGNRGFMWQAPDSRVVAFSHEPLTDPGYAGFDLNVHGHIHANDLWYGLPGHEYVNVSVEKTDYAPVRLRDVIRRPE